jgi:uncharacterized protein (UPF0335 family)
MEPERDLADYRARLLDALKISVRRSACGSSDPIQIFINDRRVGLLDGAGAEATLQVQSLARIDCVHLRSEDGVLLGGLSAPEYGFRTSRIALSRDAIELHVHNNAHGGGSLSASFIPGPSLWHRAQQALAGITDAAIKRPAHAIVPGMRTVAFTQVLLAVVVVGLAADRITGWMTPERTPPSVTPTEAPWAAPLAEVTKLEQQLGELARMQAKAVETIQTQQQSMAQLQRTMAKLSSTQDVVASGLVTVKQEMNQRRKGSGREIERMTRLLMSRAQTEQEQLEAEIHSLTVANDRLSKEMADLEQDNQDLKKKLKSAGLDVSKATVSDREKPMMARQGEPAQAPQPPQVAEARPNAQPQPFLFWVTFSEGTSQESIDQWLREMQGHKGVLSEGWQEVQIVPPAIPPDRFLEQVRGAKIVKAVRTSR